MEDQLNAVHLNETILERSLTTTIRSNLVYLAWFQALIATLGSLFFSEVMQLTPCLLCWYQRIMMYPLVVILTVGILLREGRLKYYVLPLSMMGLALAIYHNLLYYGIISESLAPCTAGISCTTRQIEWLGFITIPLLSLTAFSVITLCLLLYKRGDQSDATNQPEA